MDLNEVRIFTRVVRAGSFTQAAVDLDMPKSSVSRKVTALEERLGTRLLQRTTRQLSLTEEGRTYYEQCHRALAELEEAEQALTEKGATPHGLLRVTAPLSFGFLGEWVAVYLEKHPQVQVELVCTDRVVDLVEERFDVAIRAGRLPDSALIARSLGTLPSVLVASPAYLKKAGAPRTPKDLASHACVLFASKPEVEWSLVSQGTSTRVKVTGRLAVNDLDLLREATSAGLGIALLPELRCLQELRAGALKRVLPEWTSPETPVHAVYPSTRHLPPKVKAFVELLQSRMSPREGASGKRGR